DRDELVNYRNKKGREGLTSGTLNTPLRSNYISGNDSYIEGVIFDLLNSLEEKLWGEQNENSYLLKSVGFQSSFDLLRHYVKNNGGNFDKFEFMELIEPLSNVDFSYVFFTASGIGASRLKNVMLLKCGYV
ncbi:hypothetical protein JS84_25840, partial [Vibrio vulnificus]|uniref:hypothetical protein n=1 Tax=Vibrio vulnificus TaxID=672 RepID=UPI000502D821